MTILQENPLLGLLGVSDSVASLLGLTCAERERLVLNLLDSGKVIQCVQMMVSMEKELGEKFL